MGGGGVMLRKSFFSKTTEPILMIEVYVVLTRKTN